MGTRFTYLWGRGEKLSKIDRILVCDDFLNRWPNAKLTALPREGWSDHTPLLLQSVASDFGPSPFRFFNSWLKIPGFDDLISRLCNSFVFTGPADKRLAVKLKWLKTGIKQWMAIERKKNNERLDSLKASLDYFDDLADRGCLNDDMIRARASIITEWKLEQKKGRKT